jgi:predicted CopG family antitoxin
MSRTLTISDDLYARLEAEAQARGLNSVERLLEEWRRTEADLNQRQAVVLKIDGLRGRLFAKYGEMPDSVELVREDRARF